MITSTACRLKYLGLISMVDSSFIDWFLTSENPYIAINVDTAYVNTMYVCGDFCASFMQFQTI